MLTTEQLNKQMDKNDDHHLLRLKDTFIHRQHLCLVFELLSVNLYELIKQNQFVVVVFSAHERQPHMNGNRK